MLPVAAWKEEGSLTFYLATDTADSSAVTPTAHEITIEAKTIDTMAAGLDHVRAIVGDAEGSEPEALAGATKTLARTDFVSLDCGYERRGERTLETCEGILKAAGFDIIRRQDSRRCNLIARNRSMRRD
ncbi:MAG: hypothetical protein WDM84_04210 [Bauldia sp.]